MGSSLPPVMIPIQRENSTLLRWQRLGSLRMKAQSKEMGRHPVLLRIMDSRNWTRESYAWDFWIPCVFDLIVISQKLLINYNNSN